MKTLSILAALTLAGCAYGVANEDNLCADPPCTITPTHPWIDTKDHSRERAPEPTTNIQYVEAGTDDSPTNPPPVMSCVMHDQITGGLDIVACTPPGANIAQWVWWPPLTPPMSQPPIPCTAVAVLPAAGDVCFDPALGQLGTVQFVVH